MPVYVINDSLSRFLYNGIILSKLIRCRRSRDEVSVYCKHIDSSEEIRIDLIDKWNIRIIIDEKYVIVGGSSYYKIVGGPGKTLFYALKTLANIPAHSSPGLGFKRNAEVIDYGDMIIVVLEDVIAVIGKNGYVSVSNLFLNYEENSPLLGKPRKIRGELQSI